MTYSQPHLKDECHKKSSSLSCRCRKESTALHLPGRKRPYHEEWIIFVLLLGRPSELSMIFVINEYR